MNKGYYRAIEHALDHIKTIINGEYNEDIEIRAGEDIRKGVAVEVRGDGFLYSCSQHEDFSGIILDNVAKGGVARVKLIGTAPVLW